MDIMTLVGAVCGIGVVVYVLSMGGMAHYLLNREAIILIFGGTVGSVMISYPWSVLRFVPGAFRMMIFPPKRPPPMLLIRTFVHLAERARKEGLDSLAEDIPGSPHPFLADGLQMLIDGLDTEVIRERFERDILVTRHRHGQTSSIFKSAGTFAPIFGLLGTLIGVVQVLAKISDPTAMASSMAIAMTASFYGIFSANFLFLPIANKLTFYSEEEMLNRELIAKGVLALQAGEAPWLIAKKLEAYLSFHLRRSGVRQYKVAA
ncbi:MAG: MotA/TolQ/ExbB proton channel family protein [Elusimicrobia bacterium]|nr:MotA/TolQ/ExbB proton channel family protein [Elusimicrobiota bacterium]